MNYLIGVGGIVVILAIAVLFSSNRRWIRLRVVGAAFALQAALAVLVLGTPWGRNVIGAMSAGVSDLLGYAQAGIDFVFGPLASPEIGGHSFALAALPVIIFFASLISILYHLGIMQLIIKWLGGAIQLVTGITKVESLGSAANIFVGQSESPLTIKPYLANLTPSQLFCIMSVGMAGVAGTILLAYAQMFGDQRDVFLPYLLAASFMSAPGGILMAKIIMPDDPAARGIEPEPIDEGEHGEERPANVIMAAAVGAQTGVKLAVAVGAMVLAFVALVALANGILGGIGHLFGFDGLSFQWILGKVFQPVMFMLNVPWNEAGTAGGLFGTKVVLNEFVAFIDLSNIRSTLSPITVAITTFMLCGFANFSSIAIQMAVTGGLAPNQRPMIARLGLKALLAGSLSNLMSAALAGLILSATA
ncbi:NupC/NupG family nucleoside CNT transporter [Sphingosinicella ginsenosidimutans]|uniref:NupC/NupG family nucleoside CNT transporter n=1 Tax=Allosphingosinicella ginsenosidimutans TaxID=1176539 RepID=A0A5C6TQB4_9SPHN|nr:nucleoside transporter C-terminal domain-containing protein [Sphingosinicella ginsenosidimutans]TXC62211.1 NupC/NupG family nucleoside CNT transporter [Sphingosinicella ginsenosidimutans]